MSTQPHRIAPDGAEPGADPDNVQMLAPAERHDGWTSARQAQFLRELAATHCVSTAARAVGMTRQSAYKLRHRLKDEPFDIAWTAAFRCQYDALAQAAIERAIHGVEVPHFYKGELIHTSRRFDERAAVALLALGDRLARMPRCFRAEREGLDHRNFETMVERVELGPEQWYEVIWVDEDEDEDRDEDEGDEEGGAAE